MIRVLVVDDHPVVREGLERCSRTNGTSRSWARRDRWPRLRAGRASADRTSCCSTSGCRTWTPSTSVAALGARRPRRAGVHRLRHRRARVPRDPGRRARLPAQGRQRGRDRAGDPPDPRGRIAPRATRRRELCRRRRRRGTHGSLSGSARGTCCAWLPRAAQRQIARELSISERTVKFHVTSIFHKLGAENRAQAVAVAAQRGLLWTPV